MYVAMTRAKRSLTISYSSGSGNGRPKRPSVFLSEAFGHGGAQADAKTSSPLEQIDLFSAPASPTKVLEPQFLVDGRLELSAGQIEDYLACPLNFYWKYVLAVPQPQQPIGQIACGSIGEDVDQFRCEVGIKRGGGQDRTDLVV